MPALAPILATRVNVSPRPVAMVVLGKTAFASAATGAGIPVAVAAALAGLAVGLTGLLVTTLLSASVRAMLRTKVQANPAVVQRIVGVRVLCSNLEAKPNRTQAEKILLKQTHKQLRKIDGFGAAYTAQLKTSEKRLLGCAVGALVAAAVAAVPEAGGLEMMGG